MKICTEWAGQISLTKIVSPVKCKIKPRTEKRVLGVCQNSMTFLLISLPLKTSRLGTKSCNILSPGGLSELVQINCEREFLV